MKHFLPTDILRTIYNSLVSPHLNYGVLAWGLSCTRILKLQKKAVRVISNAKYNAHTDPIFRQLGLLKINHVFDKQCLKLYHKICNNEAPAYFESMFSQNNLFHDYNTRQNSSLRIPFTRTVFAEKCIRYYIPQLLIKSPVCITEKINTHSRQGFAHYVKMHFINSYSNNCNIPGCYICQTHECAQRRKPGHHPHLLFRKYLPTGHATGRRLGTSVPVYFQSLAEPAGYAASQR